MSVKRKYNLQLDVVVVSDDESEFETIERNLQLLSSMAEDLNLVVDGTTAVLDSIKSEVKEKRFSRGRPRKSKVTA